MIVDKVVKLSTSDCEMGLCIQALIIVNGVVSSCTNDCEWRCEFKHK